MNERDREIGMRLKELRRTRGLTQKALGAAIGRTESSISEYEKGAVEIPRSVLDRIADTLEVTAGLLVYGSVATQKDYEAVRTSVEGDDMPETLEEMQSKVGALHFDVSGAGDKPRVPRSGDMIYFFNMLNDAGRLKAVDLMEILSKVPEYQREGR